MPREFGRRPLGGIRTAILLGANVTQIHTMPGRDLAAFYARGVGPGYTQKHFEETKMDISDFRRILAAFADAPTNIDLSKGRLVVQLREDELIEAAVSSRGVCYTSHRMAKRPPRNLDREIHRPAAFPSRPPPVVLAQRRTLREARGELLDELDRSPDEKEIQVRTPCKAPSRSSTDVQGHLHGLVSNVRCWRGQDNSHQPNGSSTGPAYKEKKTDWLLLPVSLGGALSCALTMSW